MGLVERPYVEQKRLLELVSIGEMNGIDVDDTLPDWALCNLTTGQYVRSDAFVAIIHTEANPEHRASLESLRGPWVGQRLGLSEVLAARFCWLRDGELDGDILQQAYHGVINRGVWAGHRFEITTLDRLPALNVGEEWKDASDEILAETKRLWKLVFDGDMWLDYL